MDKERIIQKKVVVVIPIHTSSPSVYELVSFKQCFSVLGTHPITVLAPKGLLLTAYQEVIPEFNTVFIDTKWQKNVWSYNRLKTSRFFYKLFTNYQFILTYELDAFVFKDELLLWCAKDYDYIGAPWFDDFSNEGNDNKIIGIGNSGFSLRKVAPIEKLLKNIYYKNPLEYEGQVTTRFKTYLKSPIRWLLNKVCGRLGENYTIQKNFPYHEDIFFGRIAPAYEKTFKLASVDDAIKFSFELRPKLLFELNNGELPMGCHAWWRYSLDFWRPHIEKFGYKI